MEKEKIKFVKVLSSGGQLFENFPDCPRKIPIQMLSEEMAQTNHSQTLTGLDSRGGLDPSEMVMNIERKKMREYNLNQSESVKRLIEYLQEYQNKIGLAEVFVHGSPQFVAFERFENTNFFENNIYYDLSESSSMPNDILYNIVKQIFGEGFKMGKESENNLESIFEEHKKFSFEIFKESTPESSLKGLEREIKEIRQEPDRHKKGIEYIDSLFYWVDSFNREGYSFDEMKLFMKEKLSINKNREWNKNSDNSYSHVKK